MMRTENYAELKGSGKYQPVFEGIKVRAELHETLATTTITQTYRNAGSKNIEAVYTFPLALDAVLLEMEVTLGEKTLKGTVLAKKKAEQRYEDAISDGDAPVMLQNQQPGLYTMNVGNLLPGETAKIKIRYAMFQQWQGDTLRYHLPTNIAPRYGSPEKAGLEPQQTPENSILVDNFFTFKLKLTGRLSNMEIESPSHNITVDRESDKNRSVVKFAKKSAFMDRDIIITVRKNAQAEASSSVENDHSEYLVWSSFQPQFGLSEDSSPRSIKIVVDCSGSMGGDSISQARVALD
jgi:Ca-activated chloride channel homolog